MGMQVPLLFPGGAQRSNAHNALCSKHIDCWSPPSRLTRLRQHASPATPYFLSWWWIWNLRIVSGDEKPCRFSTCRPNLFTYFVYLRSPDSFSVAWAICVNGVELWRLFIGSNIRIDTRLRALEGTLKSWKAPQEIQKLHASSMDGFCSEMTFESFEHRRFNGFSQGFCAVPGKRNIKAPSKLRTWPPRSGQAKQARSVIIRRTFRRAGAEGGHGPPSDADFRWSIQNNRGSIRGGAHALRSVKPIHRR